MTAEMPIRVLLGVLLLCALSLFISLPPAVNAVCSFLMLYFLPGFVFLLYLGDRERPFLDNLLFPLLISPVLMALLLWGLHNLTGSIDSSLRLSLAIVYLFFIISVFQGRFLKTNREPRSEPGVLVACFLFGALIFTLFAVNRFLPVRLDGWFHISLLNEILNRGLPPLDPYFPDVPVRYMWIYHLFLAGWQKLSGTSAVITVGLFNIVNAFVFPYLIVRLAANFTSRRRYLLLMPLFSVAGLESASWIYYPFVFVRALGGDVKGWDEIIRNIKSIEINGGQVIHFLSPYGTWMVSLVDKFIIVTAFNYALNLFLLCLILVLSVDFKRRISWKTAVLVFFLMWGAFLFHVIIGASLVVAVIGSGFMLAAIRWFKNREKPPLFHSYVLCGAAVLTVAVGLPYVASLMAVGGGGNFLTDNLQISVKNILTIVAPLIVLFCPARAAGRELIKGGTYRHAIIGTWIASLLILNFFADLPTRNESKLIFPLFLMLTPLIALQIMILIEKARGKRRALLLAWTGLLFLVPLGLTIRGFFLEKPVLPVEVRRQSITAEEKALFAWIKGNTALQSVIAEDNEYTWMPVLAERRNFFPRESAFTVLGYQGEKLEKYREIRHAFFSPGPLPEESLDRLRKVGLDFYIVVWREDLEEKPYLEEKLRGRGELYREVFRNAGGTVYSLRL
ncbi:MAG: hypothetical protein JXB45_05620 [Candidatus Krumholzibacteriota bacterium]|nr:hypothetical protein [Candidatus Krumholzibacteriota bacterium]